VIRAYRNSNVRKQRREAWLKAAGALVRGVIVLEPTLKDADDKPADDKPADDKPADDKPADDATGA
jgi:hypothetical protein